MSDKGGGQGTRGGKDGYPRLAQGYRYGADYPTTLNNLNVGDTIQHGAINGVIAKIDGDMITYVQTIRGKVIERTVRLDSLQGGYVRQGQTVHRLLTLTIAGNWISRHADSDRRNE